MNSTLVKEIRESLERKSTEELQAIWEDNNRDEWREEAFEAIRLILLQRGQTVPNQDPNPIHPSSLSPNEKAAYLQGYNDYKLSIQGDLPSISKSYYNPTVEFEAAYKAGWEKGLFGNRCKETLYLVALDGILKNTTASCGTLQRFPKSRKKPQRSTMSNQLVVKIWLLLFLG